MRSPTLALLAVLALPACFASVDPLSNVQAVEQPESAARSALKVTEASFLEPVFPCEERASTSFCTAAGVLSLRFSEPVSAGRRPGRDLQKDAVASVTDSTGERWEVVDVVRMTATWYAVAVAPRATKSHEAVLPLTFDVRFRDRVVYDASGTGQRGLRAVTTTDRNGQNTQSWTSTRISTARIADALAIASALIGVDATRPREGVDRLLRDVPSHVPQGFRLLTGSDQEAVVAMTVRDVESVKDTLSYLLSVEGSFTGETIARGVNAARTADEIFTTLEPLVDATYARLTGAGRHDVAAAVLDLRGPGYPASADLCCGQLPWALQEALRRAIMFGATNDAIYAGDRGGDVLAAVHSDLVARHLDGHTFGLIAAAVARRGDGRDGLYTRVRELDRVISSEARGRELSCVYGEEVYENGFCAVDGR